MVYFLLVELFFFVLYIVRGERVRLRVRLLRVRLLRVRLLRVRG